MPTFYKNALQQFECIQQCLAAGRILAALCLLYSLIDATASLERRPDEGSRAAFVRWVEENMLASSLLPCTGIELYAARCGVLHTFTPDSDLSRRGQARRVSYAWGNARADELQEAFARFDRTDVAIHIETLVECLRQALENYLGKLRHDPERLRHVETQDYQWFMKLGRYEIQNFLKLTMP